MSFWSELIWIGNELYPRWFIAVVVFGSLILVVDSIAAVASFGQK